MNDDELKNIIKMDKSMPSAPDNEWGEIEGKIRKSRSFFNFNIFKRAVLVPTFFTFLISGFYFYHQKDFSTSGELAEFVLGADEESTQDWEELYSFY